MADILIKNMEMPKEGCHHTLSIYSDGSVEIGSRNNYMAIELPPHGRLIDADVFFRRVQKQTIKLFGEKSKEYSYFLDILDMIKSAPTVLEAST